MSCCGSNGGCGGCGSHSHSHDTGASGCCSSGGGCCQTSKKVLDIAGLSAEEKSFLDQLAKVQYLPLAEFVMKSSKESDFSTLALSPVFIEDTLESMDFIKLKGKFLKKLEEKNFITLDYDIELENYDYKEFLQSDCFDYFKKTVAEGATKENFLGDTAHLSKGSMALTQDYIDHLDDIGNPNFSYV